MTETKKKLPSEIAKGPPQRIKIIFTDNWVQFPQVPGDIRIENNIFVKAVEKDHYAAVSFVSPNKFISSITVLGAWESTKQTEGGYTLKFDFLFRARVKNMRKTKISEDKGLYAFDCEWEEIRTPELTEQQWEKDSLQKSIWRLRAEYLAFCKKVTEKIIKRLQNQLQNTAKEKDIRSLDKGKAVLARMSQINRSNLDVILDEMADAVLHLYHSFSSSPNTEVFASFNEALTARSLEERVIKLIHAMQQLYSTNAPLENGEERREFTANLLNIILDDDDSAYSRDSGEQTKNPTENTADETVLEMPEGLEPPSIMKMREFLEARIVGQKRPIKSLARAFNLAKAGLLIPNRPLLVEWWAGPSGSGKTELTHVLADFLWSREKSVLERAEHLPFTEEDIAKMPLIKVSCGMFAGENSHGTSNLIGSPSGYVGSRGHSGAQSPILSPKNFPRNRVVVLLFDEIEKAFIGARNQGAELLGILLDILDHGKTVNNWGEEVDLRGTIVIFTSNIGSMKIIQSVVESPYGIKPKRKETPKSSEAIHKLNDRIYTATKKEYEKIIPPELRTRIHRFTVFRFLSDEDYRNVITLELKRITIDMVKLGIRFRASEETIEWMLEEIKREEGVRKLKDFIQKEIVEPLARAHNLKKLRPGCTYEAHVIKSESAEEENGHKIIFKII